MSQAATLASNPMNEVHQFYTRIGQWVGKLPWLTAALSLLALAVWCWPGAGEWLQYDRAAAARGELWRLFTGHFTHWSLDQLIWNVAPFAVLGGFCERRGRRRCVVCLGLAALAIVAAVGWGWPDLAQYRGLSGLDSALFALAGAILLREKLAADDRPGVTILALLGVGFAAKVGWEATRQATLFVTSPGVMVPVALAHAVGAACGLLAWLPGVTLKNFRRV